jgi:hypothetical protein
MTNTCMALIAALAALPILLAIAGCGGGGETAEASLSKAQYRAKADLICERAGMDQFKRWIRYGQQHPNVKDADKVGPAIIPPLQKQLRELRNLPAPSGDGAEIEAFLDEFEKALKAGEKDPSALLPEKYTPFDRSNRLAERYGLVDCAIAP